MAHGLASQSIEESGARPLCGGFVVINPPIEFANKDRGRARHLCEEAVQQAPCTATSGCGRRAHVARSPGVRTIDAGQIVWKDGEWS